MESTAIRVQQVFADLTRYPIDLLDLDADLEMDLGIDSVKRGEIFAVLAQQFKLPPMTETPVGQIWTIGSIASAIEQHAQQPDAELTAKPSNGAAMPSNSSSPLAPARPEVLKPNSEKSGNGIARTSDDRIPVTAKVQQVFADLTRYPIDLLDPDADLEMDLGIDSVKRGEIFAVLAQQFKLPPMNETPVGQIWTIGSIASAIEQYAQQQDVGLTATSSNGAAMPLNSNPPSAPPRPDVALKPNSGKKGNGLARTSDDRTPIASSFSLPLSSAFAPPRTAETISSPAKNGHDTAAAIDRVPVAKALEKLEQPVLRVLLDIIQNALDRSEPRIAVHDHDAASNSTSAPFLAAGHRPFAGKIALITGSGRGLGKVMANQLADLGARVIVNSFFSRERGEQVTAEINARGGDAFHLWGSVASPKQLTNIFEEIDRRYGGLDFFVQNASNGLIAPMDQITDAHWEKAFRTNVVALHQGALLAAPLMKRRGGGKIITISSPGAHNHIEHFGCIGPVKAAVESLVIYLAVELGQHNIQVNALSAGPLYGELMDSYPDSKRLVQHWEARAPDHRLGEASEVSNTVMFLLSELAAKISGAVLLVDGASSRRL